MGRFSRGPLRQERRATLRARPPQIEPLEERLALATFVVNSTLDSPPPHDPLMTLRDAIVASNASNDPGVNLIRFQIGTGVHTIGLNSPLPPVTHPVVIDGLTQPGSNGAPVIVVTRNPLAPAFRGDGLTVYAGGSTVRGLVIGGFDGNAVVLARNGGDTVENDVIGTDGVRGAGNTADGVLIKAVPGNLIRNNVIGGNADGAGVHVSNDGVTPPLLFTQTVTTTETLQGTVLLNYVPDFITGIDTLSGTFSVAGSDPAFTFAATQGSFQALGRPSAGVVVFPGTVTFPSGSLLTGDSLGDTLTAPQATGVLNGVLQNGQFNGTFAVSAPLNGSVTTGSYSFSGTVAVSNVPPNGTVGPVKGTVSGPFTTVLTRSVPENPVPVPHDPTGNVLENNVIGAFGGGPGNGIGVEIEGLGSDSNVLTGNTITSSVSDGVFIHAGASRNLVGGANVISGNGSVGVQVFGGGGNDVTGTTIVGNARDGVFLNATSGGSVVGDTVVGNRGVGVQLFNGANDNIVRDNTIAQNATDGVFINAASGTVVVGNAVAQNGSVGVHVFEGFQGLGAGDNQVLGNSITGNFDGVAVNGFGAGNVIGGLASPAGTSPGNRITGNRRSGVNIVGRTTGAAVLGNLIRDNNGKDVVLQPTAVGAVVGGPFGAANQLSSPVEVYRGGRSRNRVGRNTHGHFEPGSHHT